ncbi:MAG: hypothetical protein IH571_06570 [Acholeplasmataceae bacterium]|nr:hypothetical protein [Acholeplasmataceae bacterium]
MASLAPLVTKHADNHDVNALHIVHRATQELALAVRGVHRKLKLEDKTLVIVGSVGNSEGMFKKFLTEKLLEIDDAFKIIQPKIDPAVAAAILAKMSLN